MVLGKDKTLVIKSFIEGLEPDPMGRTFDNILSYNDADIENVHNFIQWLFPLDEPSQAVAGSPVLSGTDIKEIRASNTAKINLLHASEWYLGFLERNRQWVTMYDHNHLRITRVIKSLRLLIGDWEADEFRAKVFTLLGDEKSKIDLKALSFWTKS